MTTLRSAKSSIPFVHDVIPGLLYVDILSRDPPEAKIVETTHTAECLRISEWKSFHVPVYFSVADAFEVKVIVRIGNVDASSDSTVVLFKKNESLEKLYLILNTCGNQLKLNLGKGHLCHGRNRYVIVQYTTY